MACLPYTVSLTLYRTRRRQVDGNFQTINNMRWAILKPKSKGMKCGILLPKVLSGLLCFPSHRLGILK